jgi:hypothetical protein
MSRKTHLKMAFFSLSTVWPEQDQNYLHLLLPLSPRIRMAVEKEAAQNGGNPAM